MTEGFRPTTLSAIGLTLLKQFEQCRLPAYCPTPDDVPTIGWGATRNADGSAVKPGDHWNQAKCDARLTADLQLLAGKIGNAIGAAPTTQPQFDAMMVLAYNIGAGALAGSTLLRRHRAARYADAAEAFSDWRFQHGRVLPGLVRRRAAEAARYRAAA